MAVSVEDPLEASPLCSKVALADSAEDPLEAPPLCSKIALADSAEDPLEAPPLCSKIPLADSVGDPPAASVPVIVFALKAFCSKLSSCPCEKNNSFFEEGFGRDCPTHTRHTRGSATPKTLFEEF